MDLNEIIDMSNIECLNESPKHQLKNIFQKPKSSILNLSKKDIIYVESDIDPQLLISISFKQTVKINSITITGVASHPQGTYIYIYIFIYLYLYIYIFIYLLICII
jgi:hypothetical protein